MSPENTSINIFKRILTRKLTLMTGLFMLGTANVIYAMIPLIIRNIIDSLKNLTEFSAEIHMNFVYFLLLSLVGTIFFTIGRLTVISLSRWMEKDIRESVYRKILHMPAEFFVNNLNGQIYTRITSDISTLSMTVAATLIVFVSSSMMFMPVLALSIMLNLKLTAVLIAPYPVLGIWMFFITRKVRERYTMLQEKRDSLNGMVQENLNGIFIVKSYVIEELEKKRFEKYNDQLLTEGIHISKLTNWFWPIIGGFIGFSITLITYFGGKWVISGEISIGVLVAFLNYSMLMIGPTLGIGWVLSLLQRGRASLGRLNQLMEMDINPALLDLDAIPGETLDLQQELSISIRDLSYTYPAGTKYCFNPSGNSENSNSFRLDHIDLKIGPRDKILITGAIGSGKSTLVSLLIRLWDPPRGSIFIHSGSQEYDLLDLPVFKLRKIISMVPQDSFLFSRNIEENIALGTDLTGPGPKNLESVSRDACFHYEVEKFSSSYQTMVGEKGVTLSGGQRQRCAIARSFYISPRFLVLDDSLSSLDVKTQMAFIDNLEKNYSGTAVILISHKVSLINRFDRIVFMEEGSILDMGTHQELFDRCGRYREFYLRDSTYGQ